MAYCEIYSNQYIKVWMGLSTDVKPTGCEGCFFIEANTNKKYAFSNGSWYEVSVGIL